MKVANRIEILFNAYLGADGEKIRKVEPLILPRPPSLTWLYPSEYHLPHWLCREWQDSGVHQVALSHLSTLPHLQAASISPHSRGLMDRPLRGPQRAGGE